MRFPNSTNAWKPCSGYGLSPQLRPVLAAEARPGEPHERARGDDEKKRDARRERDAEEGPRARRAGFARTAATLTTRRTTPAPSSTRPIRAANSPVRTRTSPRGRRPLRRHRDEQAPGGLRVVRERFHEPGRVALDVRPGELAVPPIAARADAGLRQLAARRAAPGAPPASRTTRTPLREASSCACPSRPKPVTSVTAFGSKGRSDVRGGPVELDHRRRSRRPARRPARRRRARACSTIPVPSGLVRKRTSPALRAGLRPDRDRDARCRRRRARTSARRRESCDHRRGSLPPRARARRPPRAPRRASRSGSSSGNAATESASNGAPPIANTSFSAFVAAIAPNVRGSSTSGGKKSTVKTIARSSSSR